MVPKLEIVFLVYVLRGSSADVRELSVAYNATQSPCGTVAPAPVTYTVAQYAPAPASPCGTVVPAATYTTTPGVTYTTTPAATYTSTPAATYTTTPAVTYTVTQYALPPASPCGTVAPAVTYTTTPGATYTTTPAAIYTTTPAAAYTTITYTTTPEATYTTTPRATHTATPASTYAPPASAPASPCGTIAPAYKFASQQAPVDEKITTGFQRAIDAPITMGLLCLLLGAAAIGMIVRASRSSHRLHRLTFDCRRMSREYNQAPSDLECNRTLIE